MIVNKSLYPAQTGFSVVSQMQQKMSTLQMQLGTGEKSSSLAGMGRELPLSLSVRSRLSGIEGYSANIDTVNLRLSFLDKTMSRFDALEAEARTSAMTGQYGTGDINMATVPGLSKARFDEVVTLLNQDVAGRYLFGGNVTDAPPLKSTDVLLDGEGGRAGFKTVSANRIAADLGDGLGRLELPAVAAGSSTVTLSEDGAHPFGYKLSTISTTGAPAIAVTQPDPASAAASLSVQFAGSPTPGQVVTLGLTLPDGTETQVTLTASADVAPGPGSFSIGASTEETAQNFRQALSDGLAAKGGGELKAASTFAAAQDFFTASGTPKVPNAGNTALVDADPASTVFWYTGGTATDARASVTTKVDDASQIKYGIQATESGFLRLVQSQAAMAVTTYPSEQQVRAKPDNETIRLAAMALPEGTGRTEKLAEYEAAVALEYGQSRQLFNGMASRQTSQMSESLNNEPGSIERITSDLAIARVSANNAATRHTDYKSQLDDLLADVETVSKEDVAMEILALQTRLQASYQVTSMVSKLSLVNYI